LVFYTNLQELQNLDASRILELLNVYRKTLKRVLSAMREDPKGLVLPPPPPNTQPNPDEIAANAKMLDAQTKAKKLETVDAPKVAQDEKELQANIQGKTIDMARELVVHQADQQKLAVEAEKGKAEIGLKAHDQAHQHSLDKATHGLNVGVAAHKAALDTHNAVLQTAEAMKPEPEPEPVATASKPKKPKTTQ
jgi:hypothetical protein